MISQPASVPTPHLAPRSCLRALLYATLLLPAFAWAQTIFVATAGNGGAGEGAIGSYTTNGSPLNASLVSGLSYPMDLVATESHLYVVNRDSGTVGKYNLDGSVVNASLISGLNQPYSLSISGSDLFVLSTGSGTVGHYTTSGSAVNSSLITGLGVPTGLTLSGSNLYVSDLSAGTISQYSTSGGAGTTVVSGLLTPGKMAVDGTSLYYYTQQSGKYNVMVYDTVALTNNTIITDINAASDLLVANGSLYVASLNGGGDPSRISQYTLAGGPLNVGLIEGLNGPYAVAVAVPEPSTYALLLGAGALGLAFCRRQQRRHAVFRA